MDTEETYELVYDAVRAALRDHEGGDARVLQRFEGGKVIFEDQYGKTTKEISAVSFFKKVTAVRERLRVLEQKINSQPGLKESEKAGLQKYLTRAYGSLTTFNFLFAEDIEKFSGTGG